MPCDEVEVSVSSCKSIRYFFVPMICTKKEVMDLQAEWFVRTCHVRKLENLNKNKHVDDLSRRDTRTSANLREGLYQLLKSGFRDPSNTLYLISSSVLMSKPTKTSSSLKLSSIKLLFVGQCFECVKCLRLL